MPPKNTERALLEDDDSVFEFKDDSLPQLILRVGILPPKRPTGEALAESTTTSTSAAGKKKGSMLPVLDDGEAPRGVHGQNMCIRSGIISSGKLA